ncbi:MAG: hypothetical protein R3F07_00565 [Opitutaceae bacterium]
MLRTPFRSIAVVSLVFSWLLASIAPGLLAHLSVGSRLLAAASTHSDEVAAIALAMIRGELCGLATEIEKAEGTQSDTPSAAEIPAAKILLGLVEGRTEISLASRPLRTAIPVPETHGIARGAPPKPPPRVI